MSASNIRTQNNTSGDDLHYQGKGYCLHQKELTTFMLGERSYINYSPIEELINEIFKLIKLIHHALRDKRSNEALNKFVKEGSNDKERAYRKWIKDCIQETYNDPKKREEWIATGM